MREANRSETWVVYRMTLRGTTTEVNAVCEQSEWDVMEAARPGHYTLVRAGIASEGEAERLARGTSGNPVPRPARRGASFPGPLPTVPVGMPGGETPPLR